MSKKCQTGSDELPERALATNRKNARGGLTVYQDERDRVIEKCRRGSIYQRTSERLLNYQDERATQERMDLSRDERASDKLSGRASAINQERLSKGERR